jgi:UDP-N-acetylglucosamine 2-epimerase (non-hydrolysing)
MKKILIILGTRPEAIKLAPVIFELNKSSKLEPVVCLTGQHREMLDQVMTFFNLKPDFNINAMKTNQSLCELNAVLLTELDQIITKVNPDLVMVQGDTTSAMVGAFCSFYRGKKVAHVEAGLRSFQKYSPFPEEMNRIITGQIADIHFAPTQTARNNLLREGVSNQNIYVVGNTVVDSLLYGIEKVNKLSWEEALPQLRSFSESKKIILVTGHRRENFGPPFRNICNALINLAQSEPVEIVYPVHLNPNVKDIVFKMLSGISNIHLIEPLKYSSLIYLMNRSYIILTDSGGIQEEAPTLKKPVLIMRDVTERREGVDAGVAMLVGTNPEVITSQARLLLNSEEVYHKMAIGNNPYGDGKSASYICNIIESIDEK